jgi:hypothetical protein
MPEHTPSPHRCLPRFLEPGYETWLTSDHSTELSITPTPTGFRVSLWSKDGSQCFQTVILEPKRKSRS